MTEKNKKTKQKNTTAAECGAGANHGYTNKSLNFSMGHGSNVSLLAAGISIIIY